MTQQKPKARIVGIGPMPGRSPANQFGILEQFEIVFDPVFGMLEWVDHGQ